jgi:uncharacterized membrane protein
MALLYFCAGINHFLHPQTYLDIMPHWLPWHKEMNYASGAIEIILSILLLFKKTRRLAAFGLIALLIAVFPANIQMMINYFDQHHPKAWLSILRLPVQLLLIWWAYIFTKKDHV